MGDVLEALAQALRRVAVAVTGTRQLTRDDFTLAGPGDSE
jgi:hypothetical protein